MNYKFKKKKIIKTKLRYDNKLHEKRSISIKKKKTKW